MTQVQTIPAGWIFYDERCPACRRAVRRFQNVLLRRGFLAAPLQRGWVQQKLGLSPAEVLREVRVLLGDGRLFGGSDAVAFLAGRIWWARPIAAASRAPAIGRLLRGLYQAFSRHRHGLGKG